ncbi:glycoside hydrolase domain-containing protein [Arthrobacter sp. 18067]|uniref:glycoside hydrolase domain-containing protein n=1 Tax=Arthrobacter sp. 18067 TaxID=2681413 RepID=UPI001356E060|nr:glycoside hydrolase domain-containing protein [Arthrobacter sp. 18067]
MPLPTPDSPAVMSPPTISQNFRTTGHPEVACGIGTWDKLLYGNHRFVVEAVRGGSTGAARAHRVVLPWRRQDQDPASVDVMVVSEESGTRVRNVIVEEATRESGTLLFEAIDGPGIYYFYYLPYAMLGKPHYPQAQYLPGRPAAEPAWAAAVVRSPWAPAGQVELPQARVLRYEAASERDSFAPMNFTARADELDELHSSHAGEAFLLFPEDRLNPVSMRDELPAHWVIAGPSRTVHGAAQPGEDFVVQLGLYALENVDGVNVHVASPGGGHCINTDGVDRLGHPWQRTLSVPVGKVQALYVVLPVPSESAGSTMAAAVTVTATGQAAQEVEIRLDVAAEKDADPSIAAGGFGDPRFLRRLAWLDSTVAQDAELVKPFTAITLDETSRSLGILGRTLRLTASGLPAQVTSTFTAAVTSTDGPAVELLEAPINLEIAGIDWSYSPLSFTVEGAARISWRCHWNGQQGGKAAVSVDLTGVLDADGTLWYSLHLTPERTVEVPDVGLQLEFHEAAVPLAMGLGVPGGRRPGNLDWTWDVAAKNQDALWLGGVNAGVQLALRDGSYERPLNTNFYREKPLVEPASWANRQPGNGNGDGTRGGVTLRTDDGKVTVRAFSGARTLMAHEPVDFNFRLLLTPFKPIEPGKHLAKRYFHAPVNPADIRASGATVVNVHHATAPAPYINDPLLTGDSLREYVAACHRQGLKAKIYNTVRELTFHSPELLPLMQLDHEIFSDGPGKGHIWLQEHAGSGYVSAWFAPNVEDIAVVTTGESRWENFYVRSLQELASGEDGIDGIYLDDIAYDRHAMLRVRKVLQQACEARGVHGPEIDLHSANQFTAHDGYASSANLYMEQLPYVDRLWLGEYFDYDTTDPDYWLVELSGIPFGLMGEMLEGGGNPWRGMVFGMTGRAPAVDNRPLWEFWAETGLEHATMQGFWDHHAPVRTSHPDVLATTWITDRGMVVALASWAGQTEHVRLIFDDEAAASSANAPAIPGFQSAASYAPGDPITLEPQRGLLLTIGY